MNHYLLVLQLIWALSVCLLCAHTHTHVHKQVKISLIGTVITSETDSRGYGVREVVEGVQLDIPTVTTLLSLTIFG